ARGSGGSFEEAWKVSAAAVEDNITRFRGLDDSVWQPYVNVHTQIRKLDDGGQWDQAVAKATTDSNTTFTTFDDTIAKLVADSSNTTGHGLGSIAPWPIIGAITTFAAGIVMAVLGRRGVAQR